MDDDHAGECMHIDFTPDLMLIFPDAHQACNRLNSPCVPLYDSLGENAIEFIIKHAEASVAFVATEKLHNLVKALPKPKDVLKTVIYWGEGNKAAVEVSCPPLPSLPLSCSRPLLTSTADVVYQGSRLHGLFI